jgi:dTDP-4-dehydrorhamnose 3,5-epimerase-like enzyme
MLVNWVHFPPLGDDRGSLVALESSNSIPFNIRRVYYIFDTKPGVTRGMHAHKNLKQVLVCVAGKCSIALDDGFEREEFWLDSPTKGLLVENLIWREMSQFSPGCVLLVIASEHYDESDYVRDHKVFKEMSAKKQ